MWCYVDGMCLHAGSSTWSLHLESIWLGGWGGGGVGWGGIITSMHACGTMWCYVDGMCLHAGSSTWSPHLESIWLGGVGGVGWGGIITSMHACGTMWCYVDGLARWQLYVVTAHGKYMIGGVGGVGWGGIITSMHACGTIWCYKLIVVGTISKKNCPSQMKNCTGPTINARFWDRIYQWIYRHNMSEWDIASSCEMKKRLCKLFVVSWRNC